MLAVLPVKVGQLTGTWVSGKPRLSSGGMEVRFLPPPRLFTSKQSSMTQIIRSIKKGVGWYLLQTARSYGLTPTGIVPLMV